MSELGQTETSARRCVRSVLPPEADFGRPHAQVRSVPQTDSCIAARKLYSITSSARTKRGALSASDYITIS